MKHPPRASLTVRVGVTGHRPGGLSAADLEKLQDKIHEVLAVIKSIVRDIHSSYVSFFEGPAPVLRVISPLAEGSDRIVAGQAMDLGYELQCPLPFEREEYDKDFVTLESREEFRELLGQASAVFELDGSRAAPGDSYRAAGQMVLNQCDLLLAVWNGESSQGPGGTGQVIQMAALQMIPVIWIDARDPHSISLLSYGSGESEEEWSTRLRQKLLKLLSPPEPQPEQSESIIGAGKRQIEDYFREEQRTFNAGIFYKLFQDLLGSGKIRRLKIGHDDFEESTRNEWEDEWQKIPGLPQSIIDHLKDNFQIHYAWADKLANYYAGLYRSSFVLIYFMSALAVFFALFAYACGWTAEHHPMYHYQWLPVLAELLVILFIIAITFLGNRARCHERWIDYRLLAELIRSMCFLAPLGLVASSFRIPAHNEHDNVRNSWINWQFRSIVRQAGLPGACIDEAYLENYRKLLVEDIRGQMTFHAANQERCHRITHWLHSKGLFLFVLTMAACFLHIFKHYEWLTMLSAALPAFGAAFVGILFQGEFQRLEKCSGAMYNNLNGLFQEVVNMNKPLSYKKISRLSEDACYSMINEVLNWRIIFRARPLQLPG